MSKKVEIKKNIDHLAQESKELHVQRSGYLEQYPEDREGIRLSIDMMNSSLKKLKYEAKRIDGIINRKELLEYAKNALNPSTKLMWIDNANVAYDSNDKYENNYNGEWIYFDDDTELLG